MREERFTDSYCCSLVLSPKVGNVQFSINGWPKWVNLYPAQLRELASKLLEMADHLESKR